MAYKKTQGRMVRMAAFWSLAILIFYGCTSLRRELATFFPPSVAIGGSASSVLGMDFTPALVVADWSSASASGCSTGSSTGPRRPTC